MKKFLTLFTALLLLGSMTIKADTWTVAGSNTTILGASWDPSKTANDMINTDGNNWYLLKANKSGSNSVEYKVVKNHEWGTEYPGSNASISLSGTSYDVLFKFVNDNNHSVSATKVTSWTVAGSTNVFGSNWDTEDTNNDMTRSGDNWTLTKSHVLLEVGTTYECKVAANHAWTYAFPSSNKTFSVAENGYYDVTITFNTSTFAVNVATTFLEPAVPPTPTIKLHGTFTGSWLDTEEFAIASGDATASLTMTNLAKGNYTFGVRINGDWVSNGSAFIRTNKVHEIVAGSGDCTFNADADGDYTFTWTYATNSLEITYPAKVEFDGLADSYFVNENVTFNATSEGVANPTYTYYVKKGTGEFGSAVSSYTFDEADTYTVKVEVRENGAGDAKATATQTVTVEDPLTTNFYLAGSFNGWSMTADRFIKATEDAETASVTINVSEYSNITFKVIDDGAWCGSSDAITKDATTATISAAGQGGDIAMTPYAAGNYIFTLNLTTRELTVTYPDGEQMPIPQNIFLAGQMNGWAPDNDTYKFAVSGDVATLEVTTLEAMTDYGFKLVYNDAWLGANYEFKYYWCTDVAFSGTESTNATLHTFKAGTYTFTYNITSGELSIAYPATSATNIEVGQYEYATLYSATAFDVPADVEAYVISDLDGIKLVTEPIYRIPAYTGVLLHAQQGTYQFYEGDGRYMDAPASNLLKGTIADETIDNALVHYILTLNDENKVGLFWPYGTGATYGVGAFENKAGKAYLEIPAASQPASVVARRGFLLGPGANIPTGIDNIQESTNNSQKQILNGQLFIFRDGHMFNAQGVRVQ